MSNYKRKQVFDYLTRKPITTQDIELAQSRIQPLATRIGATARPLSFKSLARLEEKIPLPKPLITVPMTTTNLVRPF